MDQALIDKIETQRLELEANVAKLRKALSHWQTLELDYEGLKDEFQAFHGDATKQQYLNAARDFGPHKVDEKELIDLIEPTKGKLRRPSQVVETLSKRVEYVTRNITSLRDQIADLEKRRNAILLAGKSDHEQEAGLPIAEITEELDEDGNVISTKIQSQGDTASKVLNVLEKAKVEANEGMTSKTSILPEQRIQEINDGSDTISIKPTPDIIDGHNSEGDFDHPSVNAAKDDDTEMLTEFELNPGDTEEEARLRREMLEYGFGLPEVGKIVAELELADEGKDAMDGDEDREMEDEQSDIDLNLADDFDEDEDEFSDENSDDDEDEDGQVKGSTHSEKYRKQMEALQKQLGFEMANVGPNPDLPSEIREQIEHPSDVDAKKYIESLPPGLRKQMEPRPSAKEAARKAAIAREEASRTTPIEGTDTTNSKKGGNKSKKKVAFAPELDIADNQPQPSQSKPATTTTDVIERSPSTSTDPSPAPSQKPPVKMSRFKAARAAQPQTPLFPPPMDFPPSSSAAASSQDRGPPNQTLADTLVERPTPTSEPSAPDNSGVDFDEELQKRQIALEHFHLKNKMVHEQGGYVKGGELENWGDEYAAPEVIDERTGQPKKISRFKAARMRG